MNRIAITIAASILLGLAFLGLAGLQLGWWWFNFGPAVKVVSEARAGSGENVYGWAWSSNIGWISFNSINCDPDDDKRSNGSPAGCPAAGTAMERYGVNLDASGSLTGYANLTGYAWSPHIGYIRFDPPGPYPKAPSASARINMTSPGKEASGWARACAVFVSGCSGSLKPDSARGGWDGWLKLAKDPSDAGAPYNVQLNTSVAPHEFTGWAWGGDVLGWVSFNCNNPETGNVCATSNYKVLTRFVFNSPPRVSDMDVDASGEDNYCLAAPGLGRVDFQWRYNDADGDNQTRFDFQVDDSAGFESPAVNRTTPPGFSNPAGSINTQSVSVQLTSKPDSLVYGQRYYWRVRVYDSAGNNSGWRDGPSFFRTDKHAYPYINFTWSPANPAVDENVQFTDESTVYGGASKSAWVWTFQDGSPASSGLQNPQTKFLSQGSKTTTLRVTDSDGFSCLGSKVIDVSQKEGEFEEIIPF